LKTASAGADALLSADVLIDAHRPWASVFFAVNGRGLLLFVHYYWMRETVLSIIFVFWFLIGQNPSKMSKNRAFPTSICIRENPFKAAK
jgi:hypothetical protein